MEEKNKKCPACAEEIKFEAKKCRYCGELLDKTTNEHKEDKKENKGGFLKILLIIFAILFIFGGLGALGNGTFIYGFSFIIIGIGLFPQIKQKINIKFKNVKNFNLIYGIILFIILIIGVNNSNTLEIKNENIIEKNKIKKFGDNSIIETNKNLEHRQSLENERVKKVLEKKSKYTKVEINKLSSELYLKYKNKEEVDRNFYERHIITGEGVITDMNSRKTKFYILFNLSKYYSLDNEPYNNPYLIKMSGFDGSNLKNGDKVRFSGAVGRLGGDINSPGGNRSWGIYLDKFNGKKYTFVKKIY